MSTRRVVALSFALPVLAFGALAPLAAAQAATTHPASVTHVARAEKPAANDGLLDDFDNWAKYNATAGNWRDSSSFGTTVDVFQNGSYWEVEDLGNDQCMDWVSGSPATAQEGGCGLARSHWSVTNCGSGFFELHNLYAGSQGDAATLESVPVGDSLAFDTASCSAANLWIEATG